MANTLSAKKRIRRAQRRTVRNRAIRSQYKTYTSKAFKSMQGEDIEEAEKAVKKAVSVLDKTVSKGILHRNNAARRKSQLIKKLNAIRSQA